MEQFESVAEAAERLGVQPRRVRALLAAEEVVGERIAGIWVVERASVDQWNARGRAGGRPWSTANAWAALALLEGPYQQKVRLRELVGIAAQRRIQMRLDSGLEVAELASLFRRRAKAQPLIGHISALARLAADPRLVRTGASAAAAYGLDLVEIGRLEAYVSAHSLQDVCDEYGLDAVRGGGHNVLLRVVPHPWPFTPRTPVAPAAAVVLDLLESGDARSSRAALELDARRRASSAL